MPNPGKEILSNLYNVQKKTLQEIADIYGVSRERVRQWMEGWGLSREKLGRRSILDSLNIKICDEYIRGERVVDLAKKNKVSAVTLYNFLHRQNPKIRLERKEFREKLGEK